MAGAGAGPRKAGAPHRAAADPEGLVLSQDALDTTVRDELAKFSAEQGGHVQVWASLTASTRGGQPPWVGLDSEVPAAVTLLERPLRDWTVEQDNVSWRLAGPVDHQLPQLGQVAAFFPSRAHAEKQRGATRQLAQALRRVVRKRREEIGRRALAEFPTSPASQADARADLLQITLIVQRLLEADGAKIYVLRRSPDGPMIWRLCNTQAPHEQVWLKELSPKHGMADWVLREGKWLLLPEFQTPVAGVEQLGITDDGRVTVIARPATEFDPEAPPDRETSVLLVPLAGRASVAGVLSVWREDAAAPPLDSSLDRALLEQFAPHIAAACQRLLQLEKAEEQLAEMSKLQRVLAEATTLRTGYDAVAEGTGRLADAACALLLHHHRDDEHGDRLYPSGLAINGTGVAISLPLRAEPALPCGPDAEGWQARIEPRVRGLFAGKTFRGLLTPPAESAGEVPPLTVALYDTPRSDIDNEFPSDQLLGHFARAFLQSAAELVERHAAALASRLADELSGPPENGSTGGADASPRDPLAFLEQAGKLLMRAAGADAALLYRGTPRQMTVRASVPACPALKGLPVGPHSLTRESLHDGIARLVLEAGTDHEQLNKNQLDVIAAKLRWKVVRSWLCCPVVHHGRVLGMIKLLTSSDGDFLGAAVRDLAVQLAEQAAWEMYQANRRQVLESLGNLSRAIAGCTGKDLGETMASRLKDWAAEHLLRPECRVLILAQAAGGASLVRAVAPLDEAHPLTDREFAALEALSAESAASFTWGGPSTAGGSTAETLRLVSAAGAAHTVSIPGVSRLKGHILFADQEAFSPQEQEAVREAARAMAVLLNAEAERNEFKQTVGHFRHATLGPIQGVQSNALSLADLAAGAGANPEKVLRHRTLLRADIEALRLWRQNERFYLAERVNILPRPLALRPFVQRCFERYFPAFAERHIEPRMVWQPKGDLLVDLDEHAFDVTLSNLLDNARKYSFSHRAVILEVRVLREPFQPLIQIMVEDTGHGIDATRVPDLGKAGTREGRPDPFRIIPGEGLGLSMAKAIVEAHQGRLFWHCQLSGSGKKPDTTPYRVRFFVQLPFHQPRRPQ
jgi:signal transduction histidine kinase